jgi:hypothetical protein
MARSKPVVAAGPFGAAAVTALPAPGFAKPPLAAGAEVVEPVWDDGFAKPPLVSCGTAMGGGEAVGDAEPGLVKPPLDGELGEEGKVALPHSEPLLWLDMNRP